MNRRLHESAPTTIIHVGREFEQISSPQSARDQVALQPLDALVSENSEKITIYFGPWLTQYLKMFNKNGTSQNQVRIRTNKGNASCSTSEAVLKIVDLVKRRVIVNGIPQILPDMSHWYLIELRQRALKRATFECIFEVQGRTRNISSAEKDIKVVLRELFPPEFLHALEEYERRPCRTKLTLYQLLRLVLQPTSQIPHTIATPSEEASVAAEEPISEPMHSADDAEFISAFLYGLRRLSAPNDQGRMSPGSRGSYHTERLREEISMLLRSLPNAHFEDGEIQS